MTMSRRILIVVSLSDDDTHATLYIHGVRVASYYGHRAKDHAGAHARHCLRANGYVSYIPPARRQAYA